MEQSELEKFDGVSQGKYTIGLGQTRMSFCDDREGDISNSETKKRIFADSLPADIYSLALTAVSSLLRKYSIDPTSIGRLEVGTETILDKSKSVKSVLMQLFQPSGNTNIEGVDTVNACYGGTNAVFNAINWMESSAWDGRNAIVVAGDIALYKKGNARPTGGAGCVAMLITPDAPLAFEPGMRGTHIVHTYDFYKPDLTSEYPVLDGQYSLRCYSEAMDSCYKDYNRKEALRHKAGVNGTAVNGNAAHSEHEVPLDRFDYMCFHSPTSKTVAKSYARLLYNDYLADPTNQVFADVPQELKGLDYQASLTDKTVEKTFMALAKKRFAKRVQPGIMLPTMCGNMYCASVYSSLCGLITNVPDQELLGKKIAIFSFGSGLASSLFSLKVRGSVKDIVDKMDVIARLESRKIVAPQVYDDVSGTLAHGNLESMLTVPKMCNLREKAHLQKSYKPSGGRDDLFPGTYYLTGIDDMFRRTYEIKS